MPKELTLHAVMDKLDTLATHEQLQALATHMDEQFDETKKELRAEMAAQGKELRTEIAVQGKELRKEMKEMSHELRSEIGLSQKTAEVSSAGLNSRVGRMETFMTKVAKKLDMDFQAS